MVASFDFRKLRNSFEHQMQEYLLRFRQSKLDSLSYCLLLKDCRQAKYKYFFFRYTICYFVVSFFILRLFQDEAMVETNLARYLTYSKRTTAVFL